MITLRQLHSYIGAFIAPSVLFFAFTGSLQLFSLHEAHGAYTPPPLIEALGRMHKDQTLKAPPPKPAHVSGAAHAKHADAEHADQHAAPAAPPWSVMALKWLFLTVALGLITSSLLGLWLAFTTSRQKTVLLVLFLIGAALPTVLVLF